MWLDLVNQGRLAAVLSDPSSIEAITYDADRLTDRSLELLGAKCATAELTNSITRITISLSSLVGRTSQSVRADFISHVPPRGVEPLFSD
jgi:hypothetical protein